MSCLPPLLFALLLALAPAAQAFTFTFNQTNPQTCEPVDVRWSGGAPPFRMMIIPAFDYPFTVDLDNSTWDESTSTGAFVWPANYPDTIGGFVAVMSDAAGLATGGVSSIMYMASGGDTSACDIRPEAADFYFYLDPQDGNVGQCDKLGISWSNNATNPVQIVGVIPNGQAFILSTDDARNSRNWDVNIAAGTKYVLTMLDQGVIGNGGSSNFMTTTTSNDTSCMDAAAPSRTPGSTWGTPDGVAATTAAPEASSTASSSSSAPASQTGHSGLATGEIVGAVIGGLIGFALLQVALVWCLCRNRFRRTLAKTPVDLFSTKNEGQEVGAPVTSSGRRNLFGRRTERDVSQYQPEPYYVHAAGAASEDRLAGGDNPADPFRDDDGGAGYAYGGAPSLADWSRRGSASDGGVLGGGASDTLDSPSSAGFGGINLRPMGSSRSNSAATPGSANSQTAFLEGGPSSSSYISTSPGSPPPGPNRAGGAATAAATGGRLPRTSSISSSVPSTAVPPYPTPQNVRTTKQMLALSNPDDNGPGPSYLRHRDMGPIEQDGPAPARSGETVELPPMYDEIEHRQAQAAAADRAADNEGDSDDLEDDDDDHRRRLRSNVENDDDRSRD